MKKIILFILSTFLLSGCLKSRYLTEQYIKTQIEQHEENQFSSIKTYTIYKGVSNDGKSYLELTGYKYKNTKGLVIGADKYYNVGSKNNPSYVANIKYIVLTNQQAQNIVDNFSILNDKIKREKPYKNEEIYHDFTVSDNLFISLKKSGKISPSQYINFWILDEKFSITSYSVLENLKKFMKY